jgi:hypothetical protein
MSSRVLVAAFCLTVGIAAACVVWWYGTWLALVVTNKMYPNGGTELVWSDQVIWCAFLSVLLFLPVVLILGLLAGIAMAIWLLGPDRCPARCLPVDGA